jgi:hypothetical protein
MKTHWRVAACMTMLLGFSSKGVRAQDPGQNRNEASSVLSQPQTEDRSTLEIRQDFYEVTNDIRKAADKMPESDYDFRPNPTMRSFRELVAQIADAQISMCNSVFADLKDRLRKRTTNSKEDLGKAMGTAFTECYQAFSELSAEDGSKTVSTSMGERTRIDALTMILLHNNEEYGVMSVYLLLKDVTPPATADDQFKHTGSVKTVASNKN